MSTRVIYKGVNGRDYWTREQPRVRQRENHGLCGENTLTKKHKTEYLALWLEWARALARTKLRIGVVD